MGRTKKNGMVLTHYRDSKMPIEMRVGLIQDRVWESVRDPEMRKLALAITQKCPARDGECEARAIFDYVRRNVRYTGDVAPVKMGRNGPVEAIDYFQSAKRTLEFKGGDCDDHDTVSATLLALNGITPRLRVTAPRKHDIWRHIYTVAGLPKENPTKWIALDTTLDPAKFGKEAPYAKHKDFAA
jgi:transglutaminase-like putative cysteine protease